MSKFSEREITDPVELDIEANPESLFAVGHFELQELFLGKLVGQLDTIEFTDVVDLSKRYSTLTLTQSIADSNMTLIIGVSDGVRMFERLGINGIQGEEFVKLKLKSPSREPIDLLFHVSFVEPVDSSEQNIGQFFNIICVTKEKIISDLSTINKSFSSTESEAAKNIFNNAIIDSEPYKFFKQINPGAGNAFWGDRKIFVHPSSGIEQSYIVPGLQPINAIQWLAHRSMGHPRKYPGSYYTFFENSKGFHFANIEQLIEENKSAGANFTYDPLAHQQQTHYARFYRNIQNISAMSMPSPAVRINNGTYRHTVRTVDYTKKRHSDQQFNMVDWHNKFHKPGEVFHLTREFFNKFANIDPFEYIVVKNRETKNDNAPQTVGIELAFQDLLSSYAMTITVYGDTSLNAGDVIHIKLPESGAHEQRGYSIYSGLWFVGAVKHIIDNGKMNTSLSIVKASPEFFHARETGV